MNIQKTLVIIKPDALSKKLTGRVIGELEKAELKIKGIKMIRMTPEDARSFYGEHEGKGFFKPLVEFISSNPAVVMVLEGVDAVKRVRGLMGSTDPREAGKGTIRERWARDKRHNIIHGSDSVSSAEREIGFFFSEDEIHQWEGKEYGK